jgi:WhiB family redox-sensing transcriptional regulator
MSDFMGVSDTLGPLAKTQGGGRNPRYRVSRTKPVYVPDEENSGDAHRAQYALQAAGMLRTTGSTFAAFFAGIERQPDFMRQAVCAETDPEVFFPEKGGSVAQAKKVCAGCDFTEECLQYALDNGERFGIWGGLSERERRLLRRDGRAA